MPIVIALLALIGAIRVLKVTRDALRATRDKLGASVRAWSRRRKTPLKRSPAGFVILGNPPWVQSAQVQMGIAKP